MEVKEGSGDVLMMAYRSLDDDINVQKQNRRPFVLVECMLTMLVLARCRLKVIKLLSRIM